MILRKTVFSLVLLFVSISFVTPSGEAAWVWSPEAGKFVNPDAEVQGTPQEQYDYAMQFYKEKKLKDAADQLRLLLKKFPGSQIAPEAQFRLGSLYEELGDYHKAFKAYQNLLQRYPQSERMSQAVEQEFKIGNLFLSGRKAKVMGFALLPSGPRAIEVFKHITEAAPYSEYGEKAQFHLGLAYKKTNQFGDAVQAFQGLIDKYPKSALVPQARFQIADTAYLESVVATRDQRAMDQAGEQIEKFLEHYPDSTVSDKAAKLRQEIDEKNAEKNYRIALYYEKENFLDSAFIYYRDVAQRYPHTHWGKNAADRLHALEKPDEFLKSREADVAAKKEKLLEELRAVGKFDPSRKKDLEWELDRVKKQEKEVEKSKPETLKRRLTGLKQKEASLKEKRKALRKKKKFFSRNKSEDLRAAFERWEASLAKEEQELEKERMQIRGWEKNLGVDAEPFYTEWVPFQKETVSPVEQVEKLEAGRLKKIEEAKEDLLKEKENLYHEYEKLLALQGRSGASRAGTEDRKKLEEEAARLEGLKKKYEEKEKLYQQHFGAPAWQAVWRIPTGVLEKSVDVLNPFDAGKEKNWESKSAEALQALRTQWRERLDTQESLVDTIARAFDDELGRAEQKRIASQAQALSDDPGSLRRTIKKLERQARTYYNEIQDRNERKDELIDEMAKALHGEDPESGTEKAGRILTAPARGAYLFGRSFLFGLRQRDVELTKEAREVTGNEANAALVRKLREEIELESLLIEARNQEILRLKREVEALRAEASLSGSESTRSLLVKFPYVFMKEAVVSANRLVPSKDRKEKLIDQLNKETQNLHQLKQETAELERLIKEKEKEKSGRRRAVNLPPAAEETPAPASRPVAALDENLLQQEMKSLEKEIEWQSRSYEMERANFNESRWKKILKRKSEAKPEKIKKLERELSEVLEKEWKIHEEERALLNKKKEMVESLLKNLTHSEVFGNELKQERDQLQNRLKEVNRRSALLGRELKRFRPEALSASV